MAGAATCFVEDKIQTLLLPLKLSIAVVKQWNPPMPRDYLTNTGCLLKAQQGYARGHALLDLSEKAHVESPSCCCQLRYPSK